MKFKLLKPLVLIGVFLFSILFFEILISQDSVDLTSGLADPTFPVIFLSENEREVNRLQGYATEMEEEFIRDTITPLYGDLQLPIKILSYEKKVTDISYEVRSLDSKRLIEDHKIKDFKSKRGRIELDLPIQNILDEGVEYLLTIKLHCKEETISYYTRIIKAESWNISKCVDFAVFFHESTFEKKASDELATYMETNLKTDNTTLSNVSIESRLSQVAWGDFVGNKMLEPQIQIVEATPSYTVVLLNYVMTSVGEKGELEYYNVEEYYRVRITEIGRAHV